MTAAKRNRARVLTPEGLKKLQAQVRSYEDDHNWSKKYTLERLGEAIAAPSSKELIKICGGTS